MTEAEWLTEEFSVGPLLRELLGTGTGLPLSFRSSVRKERLFAVACSRPEFAQDERLCKAIVILEQCADGLVTEDDAQKAWEVANGMPTGPQRDLALAVLGLGESSHLGTVLHYSECIEMAHLPRDPLRTINLHAHQGIWRNQANLLRDIFGNPFRPVAIEAAWLSWNDSTVPKLAHSIYDAKEFDCLPVLADALESAGCTNPDILNHCRGPGPHVRGCWVIDLLTGRQ